MEIQLWEFLFSEHVPDLTAKEDIAEVKAYLNKHYPVLNWNE
jgi:hypothetical protein